MSGRVAVVTGGTRGIGDAVSLSLVRAGHEVVACYRADDETAERFASSSGIPVRRFDVGDHQACAVALEAIERDVGPIGVLVNNAGVTRDGMLHKMTPERWDEVIRVNLTSVFNMCRAVVPGMRERGFGRIVNLSSVNGRAGRLGQTNYAAAKAGIIGFTKSLALENAARGITVNAVCPGYIDTDMLSDVPADVLTRVVAEIPVGRLGTSDDVARVVSFLAADEAGYITGATFDVNGGLRMD